MGTPSEPPRTLTRDLLAGLPSSVADRLAAVRAVLLDVDGVLTDGGITVDAHGRETMRFHVRDGSGIWLAHRAGLKIALITGRSTGIPTEYARTLPIDKVVEGCRDKAQGAADVLAEWGIDWDEACYVADDVIDATALRRVGAPVCVADATPDIHEHAIYVTGACGGQGAVREILDLIVEAQGRRDELLARFLGEPVGDES